jgi:poly-gamma-glutamate capsule biosynthesis protein CapA/YwtB (metallophosphatase superfamily)
VLGAADLAVVNLETAVGVTGRPQPGKTYTFRAPPELLPALRRAGVDVVTLANNHALDYGYEALFETLDRAHAAGLAPVGAGGDATAAYAPALLRVGRRTVAVVGLSRVLPAGWAAGPGRAGIASAYDVAAAEQAVRSAAQHADLVIVAIHWGIELAECPDGHQLDLARRLTAAGADVVAGHHPHILQGIQRHGRALVHYSLGNFVWYHSRAPSRYTGVWTVELDGRGAVADRFTPAEIDGLGRPVPVRGALEAQIHADVVRRSPGGGQCRF